MLLIVLSDEGSYLVTPMRTFLTSLLILALGISGCGREGDGGHRFRVRTIDGLPTAETTGGPKYADELFELEELLVLQQDPETPESLLYRSGMFVRASDGRFYVADAGAHCIAVYDQAGSYLFSFGQQGYGPGDFAGLSWLNLVGGELHAYDPDNWRVSRFSFDGHLIGIVSSPLSIDPVQGLFFRMHLTADGRPVVIVQQDDYRPDAQWQRKRGFFCSVGGDTLLSAQTAWVRRAKIVPYGNEQYTTVFTVYGATPVVVFSPHHGFVCGTGLTPELECTALDGSRRRIRFEAEQRPVTAEERARTRHRYDERIAEAEGVRQAALRAEKAALEWPEYRPFWSTFEVDEQGYIWLQVYESYSEQEAAGGPLYRILSPEGEHLGIVRLPFHNGAKGINGGYLTIIRRVPETGENPPTVYRLRPAVSGFEYP